MNPIYAAALEAQQVCERRGWRYCFIGALAVLRWGEPRLTRDVDLTIVTGFGNEAAFIDPLLDQFEARIDDAREFALENRVLLLRASNAIPVDVALGALPFEERAAGRASPHHIGSSRSIRTCGAEDLVVMKVFAGRGQDWVDVEGIVARQGPELDHELIWGELRPLLDLKAPSDAEERLRSLLAQSGGP